MSSAAGPSGPHGGGDSTAGSQHLLLPLSPNSFQTHHDAVLGSALEDSPRALEVREDAGGGKGKGLFATAALDEGDLLFKEQPLVGEQHVRNREHALVCEHCFRYIGPLELQLGFRLLRCTPPPGTESPAAVAASLLDGSQKLPDRVVEATGISVADAPEPLSEWLIPHHLRRLRQEAQRLVAGERGPAMSESESEGSRDTAMGGVAQRQAHLGRAVTLPDGSPYLFCSHDCAALAWTHWAALLSPGEGGGARSSMESTSATSAAAALAGGFGARPPPRPMRESSSPRPPGQLPAEVLRSPYVQMFDASAASAAARALCTMGGLLETFPQNGTAASWSASSRDAIARPPWLPMPPAEAVSRLRAFYEHANSTNDIMRVAARAIAMVVSAAFMRAAVRAAAATSPPPAPAEGSQPSGSDSGNGRMSVCSAPRAALPEVADEDVAAAWQPFRASCHAVWWEHVPMPSDLDDEGAWRAQLKTIACDSLDLLRKALPSVVPPSLVDERLWGSLVGMFELNNLDLSVQSPIENLFLAIDALPDEERDGILVTTQPLLDALDATYSVCLEGTALYSLQSCINHSNEPNAWAVKDDDDADGRCVLSAIRDIRPGEEICISYVGPDASPSARLAALHDYGVAST